MEIVAFPLSLSIRHIPSIQGLTIDNIIVCHPRDLPKLCWTKKGFYLFMKADSPDFQKANTYYINIHFLSESDD